MSFDVERTPGTAEGRENSGMVNTESAILASQPRQEAIDLVQWNGYAIQAKLLSEQISIDSDDAERKAIDSLKLVKSFAGEVEEARKKNIEPFAAMVSRINDSFRPIRVALDDAATKLKEKILRWQEERESKRLAFQREQVEEYERRLKESSGAPVPIPLITLPGSNTTTGTIGSVTQRNCWRWEVEDLSKVPPEYLMVNEKLLNERIRKGTRHIPGIRIYREKTLSVR